MHQEELADLAVLESYKRMTMQLVLEPERKPPSLAEQLDGVGKSCAEAEKKLLKDKMIINPEIQRQDALVMFKANFEENFKRVCSDRNIKYYTFGNKKLLSTDLSPVDLKFIYLVTKSLTAGSTSLNPMYTFAGKNGEMAFRKIANNLFHLFGINKYMEINTRNYLYGGDGGGDFFWDKYVFDAKYRDESPAHGMILESDFVERMNDDVFLIHTTNAANRKIGALTLEQIDTQNLPVALSGWITGKDFKAHAKHFNNGRGSYVLDTLNPIADLFFLLIEEQIGKSGVERLFSYAKTS